MGARDHVDAVDLVQSHPVDDAGEVRRAAHTLKSNAATFGAQALSDRSRELEEAAKAEDLSDGEAKLDAMARELEVVLVALPRAWQELSTPP